MTGLGITLLFTSAICVILALFGFMFPDSLRLKSRGASVVGFGGIAIILFGLTIMVAPKKNNGDNIQLELPDPAAAMEATQPKQGA